MLEAEYLENMDSLATLSRALMMLPLEEMQQCNEHFQTLAPILNPTTFMNGGAKNLHDQRLIIDAATGLKKACLSLREEAPHA